MNDRERDELLIRMDEKLTNALRRLEAQESEIKGLNRFRWLVTGASVMSGSTLGAIGVTIAKVVQL